jgi:pheromone shutdown protein TraB
MERLKNPEILKEMLETIGTIFPALKLVLVTERDKYMAYSLAYICQKVKIPKAKVVSVVGIGHVPGIVENWEKVTEEDIAPLMQ